MRSVIRTTAAKALLRLLAAFELPAAHRIGAAVGRLVAATPNTLRHTAAVNIERCFSGISAEARRHLLVQSLIETGKAAAELGPVLHWNPERVLALVRSVCGEQHVRRALAQGAGLVLATPHLGAWEVAGLYCSARYAMTILYSPPQITALEELLRRSRARLGARLVPDDAAGLRQLYRTLAQGGVVGVLPDQDPGRRAGVFAPFFGVPAKTTTLIWRLVRRSHAPVIFGFAERLPAGRGFHIRFHRPSENLDGQGPEQGAAALNRALEACVNLLPQQYPWCYARFRTRPRGEPPLY